MKNYKGLSPVSLEVFVRYVLDARSEPGHAISGAYEESYYDKNDKLVGIMLSEIHKPRQFFVALPEPEKICGTCEHFKWHYVAGPNVHFPQRFCHLQPTAQAVSREYSCSRWKRKEEKQIKWPKL